MFSPYIFSLPSFPLLSLYPLSLSFLVPSSFLFFPSPINPAEGFGERFKLPCGCGWSPVAKPFLVLSDTTPMPVSHCPYGFYGQVTV